VPTAGAGYKFEGGTRLKEKQTYLVYADKHKPPDKIPDECLTIR